LLQTFPPAFSGWRSARICPFFMVGHFFYGLFDGFSFALVFLSRVWGRHEAVGSCSGVPNTFSSGDLTPRPFPGQPAAAQSGHCKDRMNLPPPPPRLSTETDMSNDSFFLESLPFPRLFLLSGTILPAFLRTFLCTFFRPPLTKIQGVYSTFPVDGVREFPSPLPLFGPPFLGVRSGPGRWDVYRPPPAGTQTFCPHSLIRKGDGPLSTPRG